MNRSVLMRWTALVATAAMLPACDQMEKQWNAAFRKKPVEPQSTLEERIPDSKAVEGTVQSLCYLEGMRKIVVRGYGIVVGLAGTGGTDCPDEIRKYLTKEVLRRQVDPAVRLNPRDLLNSKDTAVVVVTAEIPAAAQAGARFDVVVRAQGNQTVSLDGGSLLECDLKLLAGSPRGIIEGKTLAVAAGPIFISNLAKEGAERAELRTGRILGGGMLKEDRRVRLTLTTPAYNVAARLRDRLNGRFGATEPVADAVSPESIQLKIPAEYRGRERRFLDLVLHTTQNGNPDFVQRRAKELAEEIGHPDALYEDISLAWEAMGRTVLPIVRGQYANPNVAASFYSARAGVRLLDDAAIDVLGRHVLQRNNALRRFAAEELSSVTHSRRGEDVLRQLLADEDNRIRLIAGEGLRNLQDSAVDVYRVGTDNFLLEVVDAPEPAVVQIATSDTPRITLLGRNIRLTPPAIYRDELITFSADAGDKQLRITRVNPHTKVASPLLSGPLDLAELLRFLGGRPNDDGNGNVTGLGLNYSHVARIVYSLGQDRTLPATVILQRPTVSDQLWKLKTPQRAESEL